MVCTMNYLRQLTLGCIFFVTIWTCHVDSSNAANTAAASSENNITESTNITNVNSSTNATNATCSTNVANVTSCMNVTNVTVASLFDSIFLSYDNRLPPKYHSDSSDKHVDINVNIMIVSIYAISEVSMDYSMSMFLRERWVEPRFAYDHLSDNITRLELSTSVHGNVWVPDLFIRNEKTSDFHKVTVPNQMMHVYPDGTIQFSMRVTGTFSCEMDLRKYPFDTQECKLEFESYGHSTENLKFIWRSDAVTVAEGIELPQFTLKNFKEFNCDRDIYGIIYPCIGVSFILARSYGYYIIQIYVPSLLVVLLSWLNFWLDCEAVPARISLGLLTVLTMSTQTSGARADLPRVSYIKAIDVWMATCLAFVVAALVEFAYVNVLTRKARRRSSVDSSCDSVGKAGFYDIQQNGDPGPPVDVAKAKLKESICSKIACCGKNSGLSRARAVDKTSRILFPIVFILFNIFYWVFYFMWSPEKFESVE